MCGQGLSPRSRVSMEEIFGPVITLHPFDTEVCVWSTRLAFCCCVAFITAVQSVRFLLFCLCTTRMPPQSVVPIDGWSLWAFAGGGD
jgi:hypothetical protein